MSGHSRFFLLSCVPCLVAMAHGEKACHEHLRAAVVELAASDLTTNRQSDADFLHSLGIAPEPIEGVR